MPRQEYVPLEEDPIAVTGIGCVTPLGQDPESTWEALLAGRHGFINLREETNLLDDYPQDVIEASVAAPVRGFNLKNSPMFEDREKWHKKIRRWHRSAQFSVLAAAQAATQAKLLQERNGLPWFKLDGGIDARRVSVFNGSGIAGAAGLIDIHESISRGRPIFPPMTMNTQPERVASILSMELGSRGPSAMLIGACATGNMNVINGAWALELGRTDIAVVGGTEASIIPEALAMFDGVTAMDRTADPEEASRPFHQDQRGFIMGEGAGVMILERKSHVQKRGAQILALLAGTGWTSDAHHETHPDPEGIAQAEAIDEALRTTVPFIDPTSKGYVNAHGTGTTGDKDELNAMNKSPIRSVGDRDPFISSTKSAMGHLIGAAGAVESIICVLALQKKAMPGTLKYWPETAVEAARNWEIISEALRVRKLGWAVNNSFGFGGFNAVTAFAEAK